MNKKIKNYILQKKKKILFLFVLRVIRETKKKIALRSFHNTVALTFLTIKKNFVPDTFQKKGTVLK